jgi:ribosome biogenesis GTPase
VFLENLGADPRVRDLFQSHAAEGTQLGRVSFAAHEQYRLYFESGECDAAPVGKLRWDGILPAVGDWVSARPAAGSFALIEDVLPRRTQFSRRAAGSALDEQVMATNVDLALVVCGLDGDFNVRRVERYLVLASESGAEPIIVLNKADLCADTGDRLALISGLAPGIRSIAISASQTVSPLHEIVRGQTVVLLGSSGAGKSTIANGLLGEEKQPTRAVRESDSRGRHTTTSRMLLPLPGGGAIIDTPGMRELQLWASEDSLDDVFHEVSSLAKGCRFADCSHANEPGCAVRGALESGTLDAARWESYRKLGAELRHRQLEQDVHARNAERKKWKAIHKSLRNHPKYRR